MRGGQHGGYRPGAGLKPDPVKSIERQLMDALYIVKDAEGKEHKLELGQICVTRLVEIAMSKEDSSASVRACEALMNRKFGKATERVEVFGEAKDSVFGLIDAAKAAAGFKLLGEAMNPRETVETTAEVKAPKVQAAPKAVRKKR